MAAFAAQSAPTAILDTAADCLYLECMTVKVELGSDVEAGLLTQAQARGLSLEDYVAEVLRERSAASLTVKGTTGHAAKARAFLAFARQHRAVGSMTDESLNREHLVRDTR